MKLSQFVSGAAGRPDLHNSVSVEEVSPPVQTIAAEAYAHLGTTRRRLRQRSRVRELVFGTQDGLLTTLGLVSGVSGAVADRYSVLIAGFAGAIAGMVAMGTGAYISAKSQTEVYSAEVDYERNQVEAHPQREQEELVELFVEEGVPESDARLIAEKIAQRPKAMASEMAQKELGVFVEAGAPMQEGVVMGLAFAVGSLVPIAPWLLAPAAIVASVAGEKVSLALVLSVVLTAAILFAIGIAKSVLAHRNPIRGGFEVALIGIAAAAVGYLLGTLLPHVLGVHISSTA